LSIEIVEDISAALLAQLDARHLQENTGNAIQIMGLPLPISMAAGTVWGQGDDAYREMAKANTTFGRK
jgi:hypothetical protein